MGNPPLFCHNQACEDPQNGLNLHSAALCFQGRYKNFRDLKVPIAQKQNMEATTGSAY